MKTGNDGDDEKNTDCDNTDKMGDHVRSREQNYDDDRSMEEKDDGDDDPRPGYIGEVGIEKNWFKLWGFNLLPGLPPPLHLSPWPSQGQV